MPRGRIQLKDDYPELIIKLYKFDLGNNDTLRTALHTKMSSICTLLRSGFLSMKNNDEAGCFHTITATIHNMMIKTAQELSIDETSIHDLSIEDVSYQFHCNLYREKTILYIDKISDTDSFDVDIAVIAISYNGKCKIIECDYINEHSKKKIHDVIYKNSNGEGGFETLIKVAKEAFDIFYGEPFPLDDIIE